MVCDSLIYCQGDLLHTIQTARIFPDSKTFVDMNMISSPEVILKQFDNLKKINHGQLTKHDIRLFLAKYFQTSNELENWLPSDYKQNPKFLKKINSIRIKYFAKNIITKWPMLGRKISSNVLKKPKHYSIIPIPNGFIAPGGRFREFYYWDSLWICKGLLICEMYKTTKDMLDNFISIIKRYGFIPNGGRVYYLDRSQPPILTMAVDEYLKYTKDIEWLKENIEYLEIEMLYWLEEKTIDIGKSGKIYTLARYCANSKIARPRPESYVEDLNSANIYKEKEDKENHYLEIRSGAESGWDFSGRWFFDDYGGNKANLSRIQARRIIPVDLNAFLCKNFQLLSKFYDLLKITNKSKFWKEKYQQWKESIKAILFNTQDGIWYDYDWKLKKNRKYFYPSNFSPLWADCFDLNEKIKLGRSASDYLIKNKILNLNGGIPSSLDETGEQWDFPNAWAPSQAIIIFGLENSGDSQAKEIARLLADRWIKSNDKAYKDSKELFEKYNAASSGVFGGGGEYVVQSGFGWTNGVALELIDYYYVQHKILK